MVKNFRYEEPGQFALSAVPETAEAIDWLYEQGIRTIVSLHPVPEAVQARMAECGIVWKPFVISDFSEGVPTGIRELFAEVEQRNAAEPATLIHCLGGGGRSGAIYGAYRVSRGEPIETAIQRLPGAGKEVQRAFLHGFAAGRS